MRMFEIRWFDAKGYSVSANVVGKDIQDAINVLCERKDLTPKSIDSIKTIGDERIED